ncbi:MAG TPA: hypothetical protein VG694_02345 [Candidatus Paceibacterota bacterium]|nr:hypothetical protein [Candidatus Paceibacterota bacterium]
MRNSFYIAIFFSVSLTLFSGLHSANAFTLIDSENVSVSATVAGSAAPGGGNTISGNLGLPSTGVNFSGEAYPHARVVLMREGVQVAETIAASDATFSLTLPENYDRNILYTLFAVDTAGNKSLLINYPIAIHNGFFTSVSGIRFAPTITIDKVEAREGDYLTVSGFAVPGRSMEATVSGDAPVTFGLSSDPNGSYSIHIPLAGLPQGNYVVYVKYASDTRISKLIKFIIGDVNIYSIESIENIPGDCNADRIVNLVDFSVMAFWYGKPNPPACVDTNHDGKINLVDFSVLAFYWTG